MMLKKRNIAFFAATLANFVFFLIAVLAIGFKQYRGSRFWLSDLANPSHRLTSNPIFDYTQTNFSFISASFGLILTGLIIAGIALILATVIFSWTLMAWGTQVPLKTYRWLEGIIVAATIVAVIFIFTGELLFMFHYFHAYQLAQWKHNPGWAFGPVDLAVIRFDDMWQVTSFVWMLIFTLLPLLLIVLPYTFSWKFLKRRRWFKQGVKEV